MSAVSEKVSLELGVAPLNFIYACSVCCASFADVYEGHKETVRGLSDGINLKERLVTRLYLANCCHVFCSSHLEGGGPPFHAAGQRPKAPCPVCIKVTGASEPRDLFSIRGFNKDEHDPQIPPAWFTAPPIRLDGSGKEMEALRFQYIALVRYCQNTHATRKPLQQACTEMEKKLASMQDLASKERAKVFGLQQDNERLRLQKDQFEAMKAEVRRLQGLDEEVAHLRDVNPKDLDTFLVNKSAIRHYLKLVPMLVDQNGRMQERLRQLGFAMALEPIPNFKGIDPHAFDSDVPLPEDIGLSGAKLRTTTSSHTAGRSAHTIGRLGTASSGSFIQRPMKRQRLDSPLPNNMQVDVPSSRDAMPPPPKSISKMQSMRKMLPSFRKKSSMDRSNQITDNAFEDNGDVQMYDSGYWRDIEIDRRPGRDDFCGEKPYMSGALPVEQSSQVSNLRLSQPRPSMGLQGSQSEFTFRTSSPVKLDKQSTDHRPVHLPTERSYIRLMDGLSSDNGVELGLKDPRRQSNTTYRGNNEIRQVPHAYLNEDNLQGVDYDKRWNFGHPFMHQSPVGSSTFVDVRNYPLSHHQTNGFSNRAHNISDTGPATPAPRWQQHRGRQIESVVSPYFRNSHNQLQIYSSPSRAEPQDSSNHSGGYQSQRSRMNRPKAGWVEPRSLNALSFFDSPVDSRNEPIEVDHRRRLVELASTLSSQQYSRRHLDSRGFITRPETGRLLYTNDGAYSSPHNRTSYDRKAPIYPQAAIDVPSVHRLSHSRIGQVPSTMPSIITSRSSARAQPQWDNLQRAGVRSSRNAFGSASGSSHAVPSKDVFPSPGRRSVRR
ncbi:hypothetical protein G6011_08642 [Alternaria panax]|uniref:Uncharacterized protein n=1 Tax=Alternaria panax TaxID=48097 RepID=A0AAD4FHA2_9PLEO|nr:hypothetical protein G6011_08642 [Alternaria panax]